MAFFDEVFKKLFPKKTNGNYPYVLLNELIERSKRTQVSYQKWLKDPKQNTLLKTVQNAIAFKKQGIVSNPKVHLFHSKCANGFALSYAENFGKDIFLFLFEYFKDKVLSLGYVLNLKQKTLTDFKDYIETKEKYYLKPRKVSRNQSYPLPQLYGNILIEQVLIDDKPSYIKVLSTVYQDSLFQPAEDYRDFLQLLFES